MVDDLATMRGEDVKAILNALKPAEREAVDALLREHAVYAEPVPPHADRAEYDASQLSAWLIDRMNGRNLTAQSREALRACAVQLYPKPGRKAPKTGFLGKVLQRRRST